MTDDLRTALENARQRILKPTPASPTRIPATIWMQNGKIVKVVALGSTEPWESDDFDPNADSHIRGGWVE